MAVLRDIWANYRDDSFISQFLSPNLIRKWRLFHIVDEDNAPKLRSDVAEAMNETAQMIVRGI